MPSKSSQEKTGKEPLEVFEQAMENVMPSLEVKARRVGGCHLSGAHGGPPRAAPDPGPALAHHLIPEPVLSSTMKERLAGEILDACNGAGGAAKKREDTHKMAEANRAFAHYRW